MTRQATPDVLAAIDAVIRAALGNDSVEMPDAAVAGVVALAVSLGTLAYGDREQLVEHLRAAAAARQVEDLGPIGAQDG